VAVTLLELGFFMKRDIEECREIFPPVDETVADFRASQGRGVR